MSMTSDIARSSKGRFIGAVLLALAAYQIWLSIAAPGKISPELAGTSAKVSVQIELPFTPERFHVLAFQKYGRVSGADDHSIELRGVQRTDLGAIARPYWVKAVGPMKEGG